MTLRSFMYACEVLRLQHEDRFHVETPAQQPVSNSDAMSQLMGQLSGVRGAPKGVKR